MVTEVPKKEEADAKEPEEEEPATIVGVLFSTDRQDGKGQDIEEEELLQQLEKNGGYEPKAYYAENDTDTQINQIPVRQRRSSRFGDFPRRIFFTEVVKR